jgi:hypothetical protein
MINIRDAQIAGHTALRVARAEKDKTTAGAPRVGSSGCVADSGDVFGICPRIALARQLGIESTPELATQIMWKAGEANEDTWNKILDVGVGRDIKRIDVEIVHKIDGVTEPVIGHPDAVYADKDGKPLFGVELKGVFGASTAVLVALDGRPKNDNLIQAAAYSWFMGQLPWALCYTSASYVPVNFYDQKTYGVKSIAPFYRTFYMEWRDGVMWYRNELSEKWIQTVISGHGIEDYYRLVEEMRSSRDLGPRPSSHYVCGKPNKWGRESMCGLCPFKTSCNRYDGDKNYDEWLASIKLKVLEGAA